MAIIEKTLDDIRNYITNNAGADKYNKDKALSALKLFECPQVAQNSALQAVVGFSEDNTPLFWDMTKGNLLATCFTGVGMNYMGSTTVLISLILRFTSEEFKYYLLVDEYAPKYLSATNIVPVMRALCTKTGRTTLIVLKNLINS